MFARVPTVLALIVLGCLLASAGFAAPSASGSSVIEDIVNLSAGETAHDQALTRLRAVKPEELADTLRSLLKQRSTEVFAVRAISELEIKELKPLIEQLVATTTSFDVVQAADVSQRVLHEKLRGLLGQKKNSNLKSTLLGKLKEPLSDDEFSKLVSDPDYLVRESGVSQFFTSMAELENEVQQKRFQKLVQLRPVQARTSAMNLYRQLDPPTKRKFKTVWKSVHCESEKVTETKSLCVSLQKESLK